MAKPSMQRESFESRPCGLCGRVTVHLVKRLGNAKNASCREHRKVVGDRIQFMDPTSGEWAPIELAPG